MSLKDSLLAVRGPAGEDRILEYAWEVHSQNVVDPQVCNIRQLSHPSRRSLCVGSLAFATVGTTVPGQLFPTIRTDLV
jgi:hypothetical protein